MNRLPREWKDFEEKVTSYGSRLALMCGATSKKNNDATVNCSSRSRSGHDFKKKKSVLI